MQNFSSLLNIIECHSTCFGWSFRPSSGVQVCSYTWCCTYRLGLLMMEGKTVRNYKNSKNCTSGWFNIETCLSLTPSLHVPTGGMILKFYIGGLYQNMLASFSLSKIEQKTNTSHQHLYTFITILYSWFLTSWLYINEIQQDATVCRYLFTANLLYMFRMSIAPIIRNT